MHCYMRVTSRPLKQFVLLVTLVAAYGASRAIATIGQLRFLSADLAPVDGQFIVRRVLAANNQELPPERGFFSIIAQKVSGRWLIVASREMEPLLGSNTITLPGEPRPSG